MPVDLRQQSRLYRQASAEETTPALKRRLASHALALAMLAERIELTDAAREARKAQADSRAL